MNMQQYTTIDQNLSKDLSVFVDTKYCWKADSNIYYAGLGKNVSTAIASVENIEIPALLNASHDLAGGIIQNKNKVIAWTDHIRSYPIYYTVGSNVPRIISNDPRYILTALSGEETPDDVSTYEFATAGFITGRDTLYQEIKCLQPGEYLVWNNDNSQPFIGRYFQYIPKPVLDADWSANVSSLGIIIDEITKNIIARANGRPIWVPLSAGLDSRIILCKLHEHGYKNLHTFTYGPSYNFEALYARKTARALNVPWHFVDVSMNAARQEFDNPTRRTYANYADGLKAAPSFREYTAIKKLRDAKIIHDDAIIINGQSGDYITGGHVSEKWYTNDTHTDTEFVDVLFNKHYDLWRSLKTVDIKTIIAEKIKAVLPPVPEHSNGADYAVLEEVWEYDARQVVLVINGQRSYEFFGYEWELPLWERSVVEFFRSVPYDQKRKQALFKKYLKQYNYKGLFPQTEPNIWRWPLPMIWVVPAAKIIGIVSSEDVKKRFYAIMRYCGHYSNQYAFFPFREHLKTYKQARNIFSLYVRNWFQENKFPLKSDLKKGMFIDGA